jgi:hypothetical protein
MNWFDICDYAVLCMMAAVHLVDTSDFEDLEECTDCPLHQGRATTLMMEAADYFEKLVSYVPCCVVLHHLDNVSWELTICSCIAVAWLDRKTGQPVNTTRLGKAHWTSLWHQFCRYTAYQQAVVVMGLMIPYARVLWKLALVHRYPTQYTLRWVSVLLLSCWGLS